MINRVSNLFETNDPDEESTVGVVLHYVDGSLKNIKVEKDTLRMIILWGDSSFLCYGYKDPKGDIHYIEVYNVRVIGYF